MSLQHAIALIENLRSSIRTEVASAYLRNRPQDAQNGKRNQGGSFLRGSGSLTMRALLGPWRIIHINKNNYRCHRGRT